MTSRDKLTETAIAELQSNGWTYLHAPTGVGKTRITFNIGEAFVIVGIKTNQIHKKAPKNESSVFRSRLISSKPV